MLFADLLSLCFFIFVKNESLAPIVAIYRYAEPACWIVEFMMNKLIDTWRSCYTVDIINKSIHDPSDLSFTLVFIHFVF